MTAFGLSCRRTRDQLAAREDDGDPELNRRRQATETTMPGVDGDTASLDAQFIVLDIRGAQRPEGAGRREPLGGQGAIVPIESGYYRISLRRIPDGWKMTENHTILDLPPALAVA